MFAQDARNQKAVQHCWNKMSIVESIYVKDEAEPGYNDAIDFFEELTRIKACYEYDISQDPWKLTTKNIIEDWKKWLHLNQENIYWNENDNSVFVDDNVTYLEKDPKDEYLKYYEILRSNTFGEFINITDQRCAYSFFIELIPYESIDLEWNEERQLVLNTEEYFKKLTDWLNKNEANLIWDVESQKVTLLK